MKTKAEKYKFKNIFCSYNIKFTITNTIFFKAVLITLLHFNNACLHAIKTFSNLTIKHKIKIILSKAICHQALL